MPIQALRVIIAVAPLMNVRCVSESLEGISLSAIAGKAIRTGSEATTTNSIDKFHVFAFTQEAEYMNHDVRRQGNVWSYGDTKFWPETDVDFYSYSPTAPRGRNPG